MKFLPVKRKGHIVFCTECGAKVTGDYFFLGVGLRSIVLLCSRCLVEILVDLRKKVVSAPVTSCLVSRRNP